MVRLLCLTETKWRVKAQNLNFRINSEAFRSQLPKICSNLLCSSGPQRFSVDETRRFNLTGAQEGYLDGYSTG